MAKQIVWAKWGFVDNEFQEYVAIYVVDSMIVEMGAKQALIDNHPEVEVFGGEDLLMLPGLVNSHDHGRALGTGSLGIPDQILEVWIDNLAVLPHLSPRLAATFEGLQLIQTGVTSVAHSHNPTSFEKMFEELPETFAGYRTAGVRVAMHPPIVDQNRLIYDERDAFLASLPPELKASARSAMTSTKFPIDDYFSELSTLFSQYHDLEQSWAQVQVSPVGGQWASDELIDRAVSWAKANGTRVQMHMLETRYQRDYAFRKWGKSFIQHLGEIGVLGPWLTLAHMIWIEDTDIEILADSGVVIAHNPSSNLRLRSGIAPIATLHHAGVNVGVGLDGHALDDDQDYLRELRLAFTLGNRPAASEPELSPVDIFKMATLNGVLATFSDNTRLGKLASGYFADVVLIDWNGVRGRWCPPLYPAINHLPEFFLRRATRDHVRHVMVHGDWYLRDGKHTSVNEEEVAFAIRDELAGQPVPRPSDLGPYIRQFYASWEAT